MFLSFDIGGTFIKYGIFKDEEFIFKAKCDTPCGSEIVNTLLRCYDQLSDYNIKAIGVSSAGIIDSIKGEVIYAGPTIANYKGSKIKESIEKYTGLKVVVYNDITSCINYKDNNVGLFIAIGTGIGGALNLETGTYIGSNFRELEVGQMIINDLTFENMCSAVALEKRVSISLGEKVDGYQLAKLFDSSNEIVVREVYNYLDDFAKGISNLIWILDPKSVMIGGGISVASFFDIDYVKKKVISITGVIPGIEQLSITTSKVGNDAAMIGIRNLWIKEYNGY